MPDYPLVHGAGGAQLVESGGTRVRFFRRRRGQEQDSEGGEEQRGDTHEDRDEASWRALLATAVEELNASFRATGAPFTCSLVADDAGFGLHIRKQGAAGPQREVEELLEPKDLPDWLIRLRSRLGLLIDEKA